MRRRRSRYWISSYSTANCTTSDHTDPHNSPHRVRHRQPDTLGGDDTKTNQSAGLSPNDLIISWQVSHRKRRYRPCRTSAVARSRRLPLGNSRKSIFDNLRVPWLSGGFADVAADLAQ